MTSSASSGGKQVSRPLPVPYTAAEAAPLLRVNPWTVRELCRTGALKANRPGKVWLIDPADLQAYIEGRNDEDAA